MYKWRVWFSFGVHNILYYFVIRVSCPESRRKGKNSGGRHVLQQDPVQRPAQGSQSEVRRGYFRLVFTSYSSTLVFYIYYVRFFFRRLFRLYETAHNKWGLIGYREKPLYIIYCIVCIAPLPVWVVLVGTCP